MNSFKNNAFIKVFYRELSRMQGKWVYWFMTLIGPLFAMWVTMNIFGNGVARDLSVAVVDNDATQVTRQMQRMIDATAIANIAYQPQSLLDAKELMEHGKVDAILCIEADTERRLNRGEDVTVALYLNNTNVLKGGLLQSGIVKALRTFSAGVQLKILQKKGMSTNQAMGQINPIPLNTHVLFNPFTSYSYFLTAGLLPVFLIVFVLLTTLFALGVELKEGTGLNLMKVANNSVITVVSGKLFPYTVLFVFNAMVMNYILFYHLGMPIKGNLFIILLAEVMMIITYQLIAVMFLALTANLRLCLSLGTAYSMMALTFSGLTFPRMAMPLFAKIYAAIFPFTYWLQIFLSQSLRGEAEINVVHHLYVFLVFILLSFLTFPRFKRALTNKEFWGRD